MTVIARRWFVAASIMLAATGCRMDSRWEDPVHIGWPTQSWVDAPDETTVGEVAGLVTIPHVGSVVIRDRCSDAGLDAGGLVWCGWAAPGRPGQMIVLGHRTTHGGVLRQLGRVATGDVIEVVTASGTVRYRVTGHRIVPARHVNEAVMTSPGQADDATTIVLVACHPIGSARQRLLVDGVIIP
jgi:sortase A